ncbi:hypothetical protein HPB50_029574 [Hyalomma asiaticum]|nr:hypothetical protein HPB50_029574 [Hyalomma asiaticum]
METLGHNLLQWLCCRLPWEDNLKDTEYVSQQKGSLMEDISLIMRKCILHGDISCGITWFQQCVASMKFEGIRDYKWLKMIFEKGIQAVGSQRQAIPHAAEAEPPFMLAKEAGAATNHPRRGQRKRARRREHCGKAAACQGQSRWPHGACTEGTSSRPQQPSRPPVSAATSC